MHRLAEQTGERKLGRTHCRAFPGRESVELQSKLALVEQHVVADGGLQIAGLPRTGIRGLLDMCVTAGVALQQVDVLYEGEVRLVVFLSQFTQLLLLLGGPTS